jgi:hypothetical protein
MSEVPDGYAQVTIPLKHVSLNRPAALVIGVSNPNDLSPDQVANGVQNAAFAAGSLQDIIDSQVSLGPCTSAVGDGSGGTIPGISNAGQACTLTLTGPPVNCAVLIRKNTSMAGRFGRGRMFLPWVLANAEVSEVGTILAGAVTRIGTGVGTFHSQLSLANLPMVVLHTPQLTGPIPPATVNSLTVDSLISTQRRRLGR